MSENGVTIVVWLVGDGGPDDSATGGSVTFEFDDEEKDNAEKLWQSLLDGLNGDKRAFVLDYALPTIIMRDKVTSAYRNDWGSE